MNLFQKIRNLGRGGGNKSPEVSLLLDMQDLTWSLRQAGLAMENFNFAIEAYAQACQDGLDSPQDRLEQAIYAPENYPSPGAGLSPFEEFCERTGIAANSGEAYFMQN